MDREERRAGVVTSVLDDFENMVKLAASKRTKGPVAVVETIDEDLAAHEEAVAAEDVKKAPSRRDDVEAAFRRFLTSAFANAGRALFATV